MATDSSNAGQAPTAPCLVVSSIVLVRSDSTLLAEVKALWRPHSDTLGFFPNGAFADCADRGHILAATDGGALLGYLAYRISDDRAVIIHLCTSENKRRGGVARGLVTELKKLTKSQRLRGIGLSCRADFAVNAAWPKLGFLPIHERAGRSKDGKTLTYWWHDHGLLDLFSISAAPEAVRLAAAMDANVYFDLITAREQGEESRALVADWLQPEIELCVADEIYQEINRNGDENDRRRSRERLSQFRLLAAADDLQVTARKEIHAILGPGVTDSEKSDRAHLIKAAAAGIKVFLTRDDELLGKADDIGARLGLEVLRPAAIIGRLDELRRKAAYEPAKLAGSRIALRRYKAENVDSLSPKLTAASQGESLADFKQKIRGLLAYPDHSDVFEVVDGEEPLALITFHRPSVDAVEIPFLRVIPSTLSATLCRHLLLHGMQKAVDRGSKWIRVKAVHLSPEIETALVELCFFRIGDHHVRCNVRAIGTLDEVQASIAGNNTSDTAEVALIRDKLSQLGAELSAAPTALAAELERVFWPVKVLDADVPTYIVPIHPKWAQHLFDEKIAGQELYGADPMLALNREHIYYRSANMCGLKAPARIVWYVTKDGDFDGGMTLRACSRLTGLDIGLPKDLFRRYQRLGVFTWQNVFDTAGHSIANEIMALRFADTEIFARPITWAEIRGMGITANFQSPVRIDDATFRSIYQLGLGQPSSK